jgi:DNA-binding transcriptional MerR regulator
MPEVTEAPFLSIGEVLGLLLEEFPDVTISKIRFLESQGLISPERTASGYRKFYDDDVQLLKVILAEQRRNYLPLRVIKDRLDSGQIDPTGEHSKPNGTVASHADDDHDEHDHADDDHDGEIPSASIRSHPASRGKPKVAAPPEPTPKPQKQPVAPPPAAAAPAPAAKPAPTAPAAATVDSGVLLDRAELCAMVGIRDDELEQLESFGIVTARQGSTPPLYGDDAVTIARPACELLRLGIDARHLRTWRTSAEREVSLYEQLVTPRYRQRNPEARAEALAQLRRLDTFGGELRAALMQQALRHHFES